jgi:hypothetical protein
MHMRRRLAAAAVSPAGGGGSGRVVPATRARASHGAAGGHYRRSGSVGVAAARYAASQTRGGAPGAPAPSLARAGTFAFYSFASRLIPAPRRAPPSVCHHVRRGGGRAVRHVRRERVHGSVRAVQAAHLLRCACFKPAARSRSPRRTCTSRSAARACCARRATRRTRSSCCCVTRAAAPTRCVLAAVRPCPKCREPIARAIRVFED